MPGISSATSAAKAPTLTLTGNLGDVMKESATLALGYVKAHAKELGIKPDVFEKTADHICAAFDGITNDDRKRAMDKERAKHLGNQSEEGEPIETPCDNTTASGNEPSQTSAAPSLSEPIKSPGDNGQRAERPSEPPSVKKRNKTAKKGEITFE